MVRKSLIHAFKSCFHLFLLANASTSFSCNFRPTKTFCTYFCTSHDLLHFRTFANIRHANFCDICSDVNARVVGTTLLHEWVIWQRRDDCSPAYYQLLGNSGKTRSYSILLRLIFSIFLPTWLALICHTTLGTCMWSAVELGTCVESHWSVRSHFTSFGVRVVIV